MLIMVSPLEFISLPVSFKIKRTSDITKKNNAYAYPAGCKGEKMKAPVPVAVQKVQNYIIVSEDQIP